VGGVVTRTCARCQPHIRAPLLCGRKAGSLPPPWSGTPVLRAGCAHAQPAQPQATAPCPTPPSPRALCTPAGVRAGSVPPAQLRAQYLEQAEAVRGAALEAAVHREVERAAAQEELEACRAAAGGARQGAQVRGWAGGQGWEGTHARCAGLGVGVRVCVCGRGAGRPPLWAACPALERGSTMGCGVGGGGSRCSERVPGASAG